MVKSIIFATQYWAINSVGSECLPYKEEVGGSSPSIRANIKQMKFIQYIKDSFEELNNHMTWSSSKDAQKTTVTVAIFTIVFALAVAGVDYVFQSGLDNFFGMFKSN